MKAYETRLCKGCHKPMVNPRPNKKFCTVKCKAAHYNDVYRGDGRMTPLVGSK